MFPADMLISSYVEDQTAAFEAKRLAALQQEALKTKMESAKSSAASTPDATRPSTPFIQQQAARPAGVLGSLWQGFFKPTPITSASSSASSTPTMEKTEQQAYAERMREIDICAMRVY